MLYQREEEGRFREMLQWKRYISSSWTEEELEQLNMTLDRIPYLQPQSAENQSPSKRSYFLPMDMNLPRVREGLTRCLGQIGIAANVILSRDELQKTALLDVLPEYASKLHAIQFLQNFLDISPASTLFAGDSGNDMEVLASHIPSVCVANASPEVKEEALRLSAENGCPQSLYLAKEYGPPLGGNYSAGVLQ
ncbi:unnamed protein product, partial [Cyprideis torosa]